MNMGFWKITENLLGCFTVGLYQPTSRPSPHQVLGQHCVYACFARLYYHHLQPKFPYRPYLGKETGSFTTFEWHEV